MTTLRIDLAYNGGGFAGWAKQAGKRTVQDELEKALETVLGAPARLTVAGRTDAGVHALAQVASCECSVPPGRDLRRALQAITGGDIAVHGVTAAADCFDARRDARSRTYLYRVEVAPVQSPFERGLSLFWPYRVDVELLCACAETLSGSHDFTAFTPTQTKHVRFDRNIFRAEWRANGPILEFWIEADAFMRNMVRILVGTMLQVGGGRRDLADFKELLKGAPRERAGDTAHPHGLYLAEVRY